MEDLRTSSRQIEFLNKYADTTINKDAEVEYLDYDWALNEQK
mgnify:CR=1 FL=1